MRRHVSTLAEIKNSDALWIRASLGKRSREVARVISAAYPDTEHDDERVPPNAITARLPRAATMPMSST